MTIYITNKETGEDYIIQDMDIKQGTVTLEERKDKLRLVDVIENYHLRYDIW